MEVNVELQVGAITETIEVKDTAPPLSTAEASLGRVFDERRVLELPLFAGNAMELIHLAPGKVNGTNLRGPEGGFQRPPVLIFNRRRRKQSERIPASSGTFRN